MLVQVIETSKKVLGQEHPDTLTSMSNLASTYRNQGRWKEADELEVQVVDVRARLLGQLYPATLMLLPVSRSNYSILRLWTSILLLAVYLFFGSG